MQSVMDSLVKSHHGHSALLCTEDMEFSSQLHMEERVFGLGQPCLLPDARQ